MITWVFFKKKASAWRRENKRGQEGEEEKEDRAHQAFISGSFQNISRLKHFHHKGTFIPKQVILGTNSRKQFVDDSNRGSFGWDKRTNLCQDGDQSRLSQKSRFSCHVRPSNDMHSSSIRME